MGKKAIHTTQGGRAVVTFKASTEEFRVTFFDAAGKKVKGATYFTDDRADAIGTAELETARMLAAEAPQAAPADDAQPAPADDAQPAPAADAGMRWPADFDGAHHAAADEQGAFYVLGYDESGRLAVMTQKQFGTLALARRYADTCAAGWRAFVVRLA